MSKTIFLEVVEPIIKNEGGYVNNPNDKGGETYKGIARNFNPDWKGWDIIDKYKAMQATQKSSLNELLKDNKELHSLVVDRYYQSYYKPFIEPLGVESEAIAYYLLDIKINNYKGFAKILQKAINSTLKEPRIMIDGVLGAKTIEALKEAIKDERNFLHFLVSERVNYFKMLVEKDETQKVFLAGWLNRANKENPFVVA